MDKKLADFFLEPEKHPISVPTKFWCRRNFWRSGNWNLPKSIFFFWGQKFFFQRAQFSWVMCIKKSDWGPFGSILRCFHFSNQIKPKWFFDHKTRIFGLFFTFFRKFATNRILATESSIFVLFKRLYPRKIGFCLFFQNFEVATSSLSVYHVQI